VIVYPSKADRLSNIGLLESNYTFSPTPDSRLPKPHRPTGEVQGACTTAHNSSADPASLRRLDRRPLLFQVANNADEIPRGSCTVARLRRTDVDAVSAVEIAVQAEEGVEDFI